MQKIERTATKRILRVFPERTALTPTDDLAVIGPPGKKPGLPEFDEIHVSCTFTWQLPQARDIAHCWARRYPKVHTKMGGPACGDPGREFTPGLYVRFGISISSRGCPNKCPWCFVPKREGKLRLLPICTGNHWRSRSCTFQGLAPQWLPGPGTLSDQRDMVCCRYKLSSPSPGASGRQDEADVCTVQGSRQAKAAVLCYDRLQRIA